MLMATSYLLVAPFLLPFLSKQFRDLMLHYMTRQYVQISHQQELPF